MTLHIETKQGKKEHGLLFVHTNTICCDIVKALVLSLGLFVSLPFLSLSFSRSGPVPSPKTRIRVMTTPATVSFFIWMQGMRSSSNWTGARPMGATATNTAPSQASCCMLTEGVNHRGHSLHEGIHFTSLNLRWMLTVTTDTGSDIIFRLELGESGLRSVVKGKFYLKLVSFFIHTSIFKWGASYHCEDAGNF